MTTEEKLIGLHERYEEREKRWLKEKRQTALAFGLCAIMFLSVLVYNFYQTAEARKGEMIATHETIVAEDLIEAMKKQLLIETEKSAACERSLAAMQSSNSKSGK